MRCRKFGFFLVLSLAAAGLTGATLARATPARAAPARGSVLTLSNKPHMRLYEAKLYDVWRALQKVVAHYPLEVNNIDQATIETEKLAQQKHWPTFYLTSQQTKPGYYRIKIQLVQSPISQSPAVKSSAAKSLADRLSAAAQNKVQVWIQKTIFKQSDFFSTPQSLPSDGMEEVALYYRLDRELYLKQLTQNPKARAL